MVERWVASRQTSSGPGLADDAPEVCQAPVVATDVNRPVVPVWLLDVDGVLNASRPGWGAPPRQGNALHGGEVFRMRWAPALITELVELHRTQLVEFRWATTWVDHIDQIQAMFGLPRFPVAFSGLATDPHVKAPALKADAALRVVEQERRPLIWADDDAIPTAGPILRRLRDSGQPLLLIAPDLRHGLQPADLYTVTEFLGDPRSWDSTGP